MNLTEITSFVFVSFTSVIPNNARTSLICFPVVGEVGNTFGSQTPFSFNLHSATGISNSST